MHLWRITNLVSDATDDLLVESHNILSSGRITSLSYWMYKGPVMLADENTYSWDITRSIWA
jgi:hypothetical protein